MRGHLCPRGGSPCLKPAEATAAAALATRWGGEEPSIPLMSFSTQVKVTPPSLLLSLNLSRKVPGGLVLKMARSLSLLIKPIMYLEAKRRNSKIWAEGCPAIGLLGEQGTCHTCAPCQTQEFQPTLHSKGPGCTFSQGQ